MVEGCTFDNDFNTAVPTIGSSVLESFAVVGSELPDDKAVRFINDYLLASDLGASSSFTAIEMPNIPAEALAAMTAKMV